MMKDDDFKLLRGFDELMMVVKVVMKVVVNVVLRVVVKVMLR